MKTWVIPYKDKDFNMDVAVVKAPTMTMAIVEFMIGHPDCNYMGVLEVIRNECVG